MKKQLSLLLLQCNVANVELEAGTVSAIKRHNPKALSRSTCLMSLLKSCNYWRSCFLISGYHYNPHVFTGHWARCHHVPIIFFLFYDQKSVHLRQSNQPPLPLKVGDVNLFKLALCLNLCKGDLVGGLDVVWNLSWKKMCLKWVTCVSTS